MKENKNFHVVGEATALSLRSTPTTGSLIFREEQQRVNNGLVQFPRRPAKGKLFFVDRFRDILKNHADK